MDHQAGIRRGVHWGAAIGIVIAVATVAFVTRHDAERTPAAATDALVRFTVGAHPNADGDRYTVSADITTSTGTVRVREQPRAVAAWCWVYAAGESEPCVELSQTDFVEPVTSGPVRVDLTIEYPLGDGTDTVKCDLDTTVRPGEYAAIDVNLANADKCYDHDGSDFELCPPTHSVTQGANVTPSERDIAIRQRWLGQREDDVMVDAAAHRWDTSVSARDGYCAVAHACDLLTAMPELVTLEVDDGVVVGASSYACKGA